MIDGLSNRLDLINVIINERIYLQKYIMMEVKYTKYAEETIYNFNFSKIYLWKSC